MSVATFVCSEVCPLRYWSFWLWSITIFKYSTFDFHRALAEKKVKENNYSTMQEHERVSERKRITQTHTTLNVRSPLKLIAKISLIKSRTMIVCPYIWSLKSRCPMDQFSSDWLLITYYTFDTPVLDYFLGVWQPPFRKYHPLPLNINEYESLWVKSSGLVWSH